MAEWGTDDLDLAAADPAARRDEALDRVGQDLAVPATSAAEWWGGVLAG